MALAGRICESTTHLHEFFEDEVTFRGGAGDMLYVAPTAEGFAKFHDSALGEWVWPHGTGWANEEHVGAELKGKAQAAIDAERAAAVEVLKKAGGIRGWLASL